MTSQYPMTRMHATSGCVCVAPFPHPCAICSASLSQRVLVFRSTNGSTGGALQWRAPRLHTAA